MTRRLLSDTDGLIEAIALCLPRGLEHRELMAAHRGLLRQLPAEIAVTLATPPEHVSAVSSWLDRQHAGRHAVVAAGEELDEHAIWVQDPLLVTTDRGRRAYLRVASEYPYPVAHWLAAAEGIGVDRTQLHLSGGNSLVGHNFRFAGVDAVLHDAGRGMPAAIRRAIERHRSLDPRRLHIYGYGETPIAGMPWAQEPFHLDLALALTGCHTAREHPIVLLARPQSPSPALDATAERLAGDGFHVVRVHVPVQGNSLYGYNNVLVETAVRPGQRRPLVFVPQYGDRRPSLARYDRYIAELWSGLGFTARGVTGWGPFVFAGGAVRCATKVLSRSALSTPERIISNRTLARLARLTPDDC